MIHCDEKDRAIAGMLPSSIALRFTFDLLGGVILDCFGTKVVSVTG